MGWFLRIAVKKSFEQGVREVFFYYCTWDMSMTCAWHDKPAYGFIEDAIGLQ